MTAIAFSPAIGPVPISCRLEEHHTTEIEITSNPIETGAEVNDHAYIKPNAVTLEVASASAAATYNALVAFQKSRVPFTLVTGLSVFPNMLIQRVEADRDKDTSHILRARVDLQEVIIVDTAYAAVDTDSPGAVSSGAPGGKKSTSAAPPAPAGTTQGGDAPAKPVAPAKQQSLLARMF